MPGPERKGGDAFMQRVHKVLDVDGDGRVTLHDFNSFLDDVDDYATEAGTATAVHERVLPFEAAEGLTVHDRAAEGGGRGRSVSPNKWRPTGGGEAPHPAAPP